MANHVVRIGTADLKGTIAEVAGMPIPGALLIDSGTLAFSDVDVGDTHTVTVSGFNAGSSNVASALGTLTAVRTADTTGGAGGLVTWTYQVNAAAIEYLAKGQKRTEAFDVTIDDGHGSVVTRTIVVTITGSNDGPVVSAADLSGAVTEVAGQPASGTTLSDSGTIAFTDVDLTNTHSVRVSEIGDPFGRVTASVTSDTTGSGSGGLVTWTYEVAAAKVEHLAAGEQLIETFDIIIKDKNGGSATQTVSVTATGTNDGVVLANRDVTGRLNETAGTPAAGAQLSDTGDIKFSDADISDAHTVSVVGFNAGASNVGSALGTITASLTADTVNGKGGVLTWTYTVNADAVEYLNAGGTRVEAFDIIVDDGHGGAAVKTVVVTIRGSNDASANQPPIITSGVQSGTATEIVDNAAGENATTHSQAGTITFTDSNPADTHAASFAAQAGGYLGTFALDSLDQTTDSIGWTFSVADAALDYLKAGQTLIQNYDVTVNDDHGGTATQTVSITITGTNDGATINGSSISAVAEDSTLTTGGTLAVSDADSGESQFQTPASLAGSYGTFSFDATTGVWGYTLDNSATNVQALANGATVHDTLTVSSADGTASQLIDVTITGTNDGASISGSATGAVAEDGTLTAGGTLSVSDADSGESQFQTPASLAGSYGTFSFDATTGVWGYTLDNSATNVQALANGATVHDTLTVSSTDGSASQVIDVTITGSNDGATISGSAAGAVTEDGALTTGGTLAVSDTDSGESQFQTPASLAGSYGTFSFDATTGVWGYTLDNSVANVQALAAGAMVHDALTVSSADGTASQVIDVTITGTNDGAIISGSANGAVAEDGTLTTGGTLSVSDADSGESQFQTPASLAGSYGTFSFDASTGVWGYTLDNAAAQALANGEVVHDTLTVSSADGSASQVIDVTITGTNDAPTIGASSGAQLINGSFESPAEGFYHNYFASDDPNAIPGWQITQAGVQIVGPFWQASDGLNSLQMENPGFNHFGAIEQTFATTPGTEYHVTFDMTANWADGGTHSIQVSADGQSDAYFANGSGNNNSNMGWSPRDFSFVADDSSATLRIQSTDTFLYGAVVDNFVLTAEDGDGATEGEVTEAADGSADETSNVTHQATGTIAFADVDLSDTHTVSVTLADGGYRGTLSASVADDTTGAGSVSWTFEVDDSALDDLADGETLTQSYDVTVDDGQGGTATQTVSVTITGSDDGATISGSASGAVAEDGTLTTGGTLTVNDADSGESQFQTPASLAGSYGTFSFDATTGEWGYTLDNSAAGVQALANGTTMHDTLEVHSADGSASQVIDVTITGTNDAPTISGAVGSGNLLVNGSFEDSPGNGTYNSYFYPADAGALPGWQITQDGVQLIGEPYWQASDGLNSVQMKVAGYNHFGAIEQTFATTPGTEYQVTFDMTANWYDGATHSIAVSADGQSDAYFANGSGNNNSNMGWSPRSFNFVADDSSATLRIESTDTYLYGAVVDNFMVSGGGGASEGAVTEAADGSADELGNVTHQAVGAIAFADIDLADTHTVSVAAAGGGVGYRGTLFAGIANDTTGDGAGSVNWTFEADDSGLDDLADGETLTQTYDVTVDDGQGGTATQTVSITITGSNDGATISGSATGAVDEDGTLSTGGTLTVSDADGGESQFQTPASLTGSYGSFSFDAGTGVWGYTLDNSTAGVQALASGTVVHDTLTVSSADGTASQVIDVTITGINDGATISGSASGAVDEDGTFSTGGTLTVSDADSGESQFQTPASLAGTYGTFSFDAGTGVWGYTLDNGAANVQALANGAIVHDTLTVSSADGTASQVIDVTITGSDDGATINGSAGGAVAEDGTLTAGGTLSVSDADSGESQFQTPASLTGSYGTFSFNAGTGVWGYTLDNGAANVQALANGAIVHDTLTVSSADGSASQVIDVTITGSNDAPTISGAVGSGNLLVNGSFEESPGNGFYNNYFAATEPNALPGWLITQDGVQLIGEPYWQASEGLNSVQMKVAGVNHHGAIEQTFATTPGTEYQVAFDMTANWADGATHSIAVSADGQSDAYFANGSGNNNSNMGWSPRSFSFVADDSSATLRIESTDTFLYGAVVDNFVVTGGGGASEGSVTEAADGSADELGNVTHQAAGAIAFADIDLADTHTVSVAAAGGGVGYRGTLSAGIADDTTGDGAGSVSWTFDVDDADLEDLADGETLTQTYDVTVDDGQGGTATQTVTVTITGTNDGATIDGTASGAVAEDVDVQSGNLTTSGDLTIADVDAGEGSFQAQAGTLGSSGYGTFTLDADGHWTYAADNSQAAIQGLAVDEDLTDSFTAVSTDGTAFQTVTVTINGANDVTYVADGSVDPSATKLGAGTQLIAGSGIPANHFGLANQIDTGVELGLQVIYRQGPVVSTSDTYADGVLHFTVNDGAQSTLNGSSVNNAARAAWSFDYSIATGLDGEPGNLNDYTFNLLYDVDPTAGTSYRTLTLEPGGSGSSAHQWRDQGTGLVFFADDAGNANVTQNSENYAFSQFQSFMTSPYGAGNNFDGPAQFDLVLEAHRSGQLLASNHVVVDVVETNDPPTANPDSNGADAVIEAGISAGDASASGNVLTNDTDPDVGDSKTVTTTGTFTGTYGTLTLNANGSWTYALDNGDSDTNVLTQGQTVSDVFNYTMRDGESLAASSTLTINITGANDGATISGSSTGAVVEDGTLTTGGTLSVSDADSDESQFQTPASLAGSYGTFSFDAGTGEWGYTLDNAAAQALANGEVVHDTLTVDSVDGSASQVIDVTITGTNDAPTISGAVGSGNLLVNGSFESPDGGGFYNNFYYPADAGAIPGWQITQAGVQIIGEPYWQASDGLNSLQVKNPGVNHFGVIEQIFATTPGTQYDVTFDMTANWADGATHSIAVSADGQSQGYSASGAGYNNSNMGWSPRSFSFVADDSSATLRIQSTDTFLYGAVVDNFVVTGGGGASEGSVTEAADGSADETNNVMHQATGAIAFADIDLADTHTVSVAAAGGGVGYRGTLSAGIADDTTGDGAGSVGWTFDVDDAALDDLADGETVTQTYDVMVDDGQGGTATQTVTINITGRNDNTPANVAPFGLPDTYSVAEASNLVQTTLSVNAANGVLGNGFVGDFDPDDGPQPLTAVLETGPSHAAFFQFNPDGSFVYQPEPYYLSYTSETVMGGTFSTNYSGPAQPDTFTYRAFDGQDYSAPVTVSITVTPPPLVGVNPLGYDMQGSHDAVTEPMGKLYDDLALGGRTFTRGIEIPGSSLPISDSVGFTVATDDLVFLVHGSGFQYDAMDTPTAGTIIGLTIRNPAYDPDAPAPNLTPIDLLSMLSSANGPAPAWNVPVAGFIQALEDYATSGDRDGLDAIFQNVRYSQVGAGPTGYEVDGMVGGQFDDSFAGAVGYDAIIGGPGNDFIIPGADGGISTGGTGADWFQFGGADSINVITDFSGVVGGENDVIDLRAVIAHDGFGNTVYTPSDFAEVLGQATQVGADTVLDFSFGQTDPLVITLQNTSMSNLHQNDFLYSIL